jgi:hypothetical protein
MDSVVTLFRRGQQTASRSTEVLREFVLSPLTLAGDSEKTEVKDHVSKHGLCCAITASQPKGRARLCHHIEPAIFLHVYRYSISTLYRYNTSWHSNIFYRYKILM